MLRRLVVPLLAAAACAPYQPGTLGAHAGGQVRQLACLDVAVQPDADPRAQGVVTRIVFANRCDAAVWVDLSALRATARLGDGGRTELRLYDPSGVVEPGLLEARRSASEVLEFQSPVAVDGALYQVCLDLSRIESGARLAQPVIACLDGAPPQLAEFEVRR